MADLPRVLHNARMELLDGVPTVFGGIGNNTRSNKLYQYNHTIDEWREHPRNLRLETGRDAAAVFRVITSSNKTENLSVLKEPEGT